MDKIEEFSIHLDLADCESIYDYVAKEEIRKPSSGFWSPVVFEGRGLLSTVPTNDDNERTRISLMDKYITDTLFMEKKIVEGKQKEKEQKEKDVDDAEGAKEKEKDASLRRAPFPSTDDLIFGNPDEERSALPRRLLPIYKPGDQVKGHVILKLKEAIAAESLKLNFVGQTAVNVRFYNKYEDKDNTQYEKFANETRILWSRNDDRGRSQNSDKYKLLETPESPSEISTEIEAGEHKFHFEFDVPDDAPRSIPPLVISSVNFAHLVWRLKAKLHMGAFFNVGNIATHRGIWINKDLDVATFSDAMDPVVVEERIDTGLVPFKKGGKLMCRASIPRSGQIRGNSVKLKLEIENQSKSEISKIQAYIRLHGRAKLSGQKITLSNKIHLKSEKVIEGPIGAGMCPTYEWNLEWDWTESSIDGLHLPLGQAEESKLLEYRYEVVVKISRKGLHRNMELTLPLSVGSYNSIASKDLFESCEGRENETVDEAETKETKDTADETSPDLVSF